MNDAPEAQTHHDRPQVKPATVSVFCDVACGWATVALSRFYAARERNGIDPGKLRVEHRPFLLEDHNGTPHQKVMIEAQIGVFGQLEPEFGWVPWQAAESEWPVTSLLANEAVRAAQKQGLAASERLDWALRRALFCESRCISMRHEIQAVADGCDLDVAQLMADLDSGSVRAAMWSDYRRHRDLVDGSPHFFTYDGIDAFNPGVRFEWEGEPGASVPVVERNQPELVDLLLHQATA